MLRQGQEEAHTQTHTHTRLSRAKGASQDTPASKTGKYQRQLYLKESLYNRVQLDTKLQEAPQSVGQELAFLLTD